MPRPVSLPPELVAVVHLVVAGIGPALSLHSSADIPNGTRVMNVARLALAEGWRYAPAAPLEVHVEAAIRHAAYLIGTPVHVSKRNLTDPSGSGVDLAYLNFGASNGFRRSGARRLLSTWRTRRITS